MAVLSFDPGRWRWSNGKPLLHYTASIGRKLLTKSTQLTRPIPSKWPTLLQDSFAPLWKDIWIKARPQKDAAFIWSVWHNAVAVNSWRAQIAPGIDSRCVCCPLGVLETPIHWFFECPRAQEVWDYAQSMLHHIRGAASTTRTYTRLNAIQCIFGTSPL